MKKLPQVAIDFPDEYDPLLVEAFRGLVLDARRAAQIDHANGVTLKDGLEAFRADGATELELHEYALARSLSVMKQIAASSGISIVTLSGGHGGKKETVH